MTRRPLSPRAVGGAADRGTVVERMALAICAVDCDTEEDAAIAYAAARPRHMCLALAALSAMRGYRPVVREKGAFGVVAELRGAPADLWVAMIDAAIAEAANA
jgi:hypothetical protein